MKNAKEVLNEADLQRVFGGASASPDSTTTEEGPKDSCGPSGGSCKLLSIVIQKSN